MTHPSANNAILTFGKYKGHTLAHVYYNNQSYLIWMTQTVGIPEVWKEAATLTLRGEDISQLKIARTNNPTVANTPHVSTETTVSLQLKDTKTAVVVMPYNPTLMAKFKYEIDGRKWNGQEKWWEFPAVHLPKAFKVFGEQNIKCDETVLKLLEKLKDRREDLDEIRGKDDIDFDIKGMQLSLYAYQRVGVRFIERADGRCLIADAPGLGKTAQAIGFAQHKKLKTIIVCPLSVVVNWKREIKKFTGKEATVWDSKSYDGKLSNQFHICHYDAVGKIVNDLRKQEFDLLVCDEATYLKNRQTIRAKSILGSYKERRKYPGIKTKYCLFLTGTPVMSRPIEAFALLNFLDKDRFNNFFHFTQRYGGWRGDAPRNLQDLHDRTKDLVIRRKKEQILTELPVKQRNDLYVELTKDEQKQYRELLREIFGRWKVEKPSIGHMPKLQGFLIDKKIPRLIEMVDEFLDNDKPILIFSNYLKPLKFLAEHYGTTSALLTGEMNSKERQISIDRLTKGEAKVGLFSLTAAGMGIDGLQHKIDTVVFLNCDWVPANHEQAEDRTHRIGQTGQVQVYYMMCADTIDEYMRDILKEKQQIADLVVDGALVTPERSKSYFKEFVKKLNSVYNEDISSENVDG
jgi:SWI/SNF-related matrix-associated actin-dependent regulator of chromatin subfamily A-like protein 1